MKNLPKRKNVRLQTFDYSSPGAYFITLCTKDRKPLLSTITVGTGVLDCPQNTLTIYGEIADRVLCQMRDFYQHIAIDNYIIMPNHVHLLLRVHAHGQSGRPVPTERLCRANSAVSMFIGTFKRLCNREYGKNIWQARSNDHIIRGNGDYEKIWEYIENNVMRWEKDCFFIDE